MSLKYLTLEVPSDALKDVKRWYEDVIGMTVMRQSSSAVSLGFPNQGSSVWVELLASEKRGERRGDNASEDVYWKIGLGLADVSAAREKLMKRGAAVSEPQQFM